MAAPSAGTLGKRVTLQQRTPAVDAYGQPVEAWTDVVTVWAAIEPASGREFVAAQALRLAQPVTITARWQPSFGSLAALVALRAVWNGRVFAIHSAENEDEANRTVRLLASEES